jgi:aminopeptidase N
MPRFYFVLLLMLGISGPVFSQGEGPVLRRTVPRDLLHHGCRHAHAPMSDLAAMRAASSANIDMTGSLARSDSFDVLHYGLELDVTTAGIQQVSGAATVTFETLEAGANQLWFDLVGSLEVSAVELDGVAWGYAQEGDTISIAAPDGGWPADGPHEVQVVYAGQPGKDPYWGGMYLTTNYIYSLGIGLTSIPPNHGKAWYPCFDTFRERAGYTYGVTSAGGKALHGQGNLVATDSLGGDTIRRVFDMAQPIPTYLSTIAVSDYVDFDTLHTGVYGEIPIRLTARPGNLQSMRNRFVDLPVCIDALEDWWGPHAWERVGYVITTDGAMEHPTNIAYPLSMLEQSNFQNEGLYGHELGHHWWGNMLSPLVHNHMWIKEGFAEYSSHLFEELLSGRADFVEMVKDNQLFVLEQAHLDDEGFWPLSPIPDAQIYGRHSYNKGASVVHNLRNYLGDDLFRSGGQAVLATHYGGAMDDVMLEAAWEEATGVDLTPWFDAHIRQPGFSTWVLDSSSTMGLGAPTGHLTTLHLQQKLRACTGYHENEPLDVTVWDADGNREVAQIVVGGQYATADVITSISPVMVALNAEGRLNQGRMDLDYWISETSSLQNLPWVDMRIGCDAIADGDSALVRVEHHWAGPDGASGATPAAKAPYVDQLSSTHFWSIDGIWPDEGMLLDARFTYRGGDEDELDFDLYGDTEAQAFLAWRASPADVWVEYPDYEIQMGSAFNGSGVFKVSRLRRGQYAFANGDVSVGVEGAFAEAFSGVGMVYPNPARDEVRIVPPAQGARLQVWDAAGRQTMRLTASDSSERMLNVAGWERGVYVMVWTGSDGLVLGQDRLVLE